MEQCPLNYTSPNASSKRDVLGTLMLGILSGSKRYAHIAGVRGDAVAAQALGMQGVVSEDSVRQGIEGDGIGRERDMDAAIADGQRARCADAANDF
ncbi:MAG TPA: hypothetical protein VFP68_08640 [Burkholderiaceae bacterium]|nr:hypothetical protein [Burkholderiaceae bacterium]